MRLCDILSPVGTKPAKNFASFYNQFATPHSTHIKHNDKNSFCQHANTLTRTQIQKQTKFLQINAPNAPGNHAKSHNRNCHKTQKSQQTVKKRATRPALPQPTAIKTPQTSRNPPFYPSQPQNSNFHHTHRHIIYTGHPQHPRAPRNFKKRPNLHPLITALCLHTPILGLSYCKHSVF